MTNVPLAWRRHACFICLLLLAAVACHGTLWFVAASSLSVDAYALFAFIPPISAALIWAERRQIFSQAGYWRAPAPGYLLLTATLLWPYRLGAPFSILLLAAACIAGFALCYGRDSARRARFPLALLLATAPMPQAWLDRAVLFLQQGSASATAWLFALANVPFVRRGMVFALPKLDIEIAKECSGIRSSLVLFICGLVLGHLFLRSGWPKAVLAVAVIPISIAKNGLRIFTLSVLGMYVDPSFLTGRLHRDGGVLFFALAFAGLLGLIWLLRKAERRSVPAVHAGAAVAVNHTL